MTASTARLNDIYDRTSGRCHLCGKRLAFHNYCCHGTGGAFHIGHSVPRANGGTDRRSNLYPGYIPCNLSREHDPPALCAYGITENARR